MVDLALWGAALKKINNKTARCARACEEAQRIGWGAMELLYEPSGTIASITVWRWRLSAMISNSGTVPHLWIWIISWYLQGSWNNLWHLRETMSFRSISRGLDGALERAAGLAFISWASLPLAYIICPALSGWIIDQRFKWFVDENAAWPRTLPDSFERHHSGWSRSSRGALLIPLVYTTWFWPGHFLGS